MVSPRFKKKPAARVQENHCPTVPRECSRASCSVTVKEVRGLTERQRRSVIHRILSLTFIFRLSVWLDFVYLKVGGTAHRVSLTSPKGGTNGGPVSQGLLGHFHQCDCVVSCSNHYRVSFGCKQKHIFFGFVLPGT